MNKWLIVFGILVLVGLGLFYMFNSTGNAVFVEEMEVSDGGSFRISDFGVGELNESEVVDGEVESGSG
jgi:hypothetical protein